MRPILLAPFALAAVAPSAAVAETSHVYGVIFEVSLGQDGKVDELTVAKVIDPSSGSTDPVAVTVPEAYVAAAKEYLRMRTYPTDETRFFTYLFYDPSRPTAAAFEPKRPASNR